MRGSMVEPPVTSPVFEIGDKKMNANNSIIITDRNLTTTEEQAILETGMMDLADFMDTFQYLAFVLDGSGSMFWGINSGDGLNKVELEKKVILRYAKDKIGAKADGMKVAIVEFGSKAHIHLRGSSSLAEIEGGVNLIGHMGGGTNASKGIRAGLTLLKKGKGMIPRIILTSDGQIQDLHLCLEAAEQAKSAGVIIDTIYIGGGSECDHGNGEMLRRISSITGGVHEEITGMGDFEVKFLKVADRILISA